MTARLPKLQIITLISVALLIGQFFALVHWVEHPFHAEEASCDTFIALEKSGNGLTADFVAPGSADVRTPIAVPPGGQLAATPPASQPIRAPPTLS
ncbi:MAG: hypothetical protein VW985_00925 [Gammaproteobacteria bacterium]